MLLYGVVVWWPALSKITILKIMSKVQRSTELCISGALTTTPTEALNVILHNPALDLISRSLVLTRAVRLREIVGWTHSNSSHSSILNKFDYIASKTDYCSPTLTFTKNYKVIIPKRDDWN